MPVVRRKITKELLFNSNEFTPLLRDKKSIDNGPSIKDFYNDWNSQYEELNQTTNTNEPEDDKLKMKAEMTLINGCNVIVGCIIGSGIFIAPTGVLASTGSVNLSLVIWLFCGVFCMIGAYCYAELGCMIKKSGGDYAYIHVSLGPLAAFVRLWIECMIVRPCTAAIQSQVFALYIIKPLFPDCSPPDDSLKAMAINCLCLLCFINCASARLATKVQDYFTYAKVFALMIIIITGFVQLFRGETQYFTWENSVTDISVIATSCYSGLFAFTGWNNLNFMIEEMKNPVRDLPRAIAISLTLCLGIYVLTIVAFHTTLSNAEVLVSEAVAVTFANRLYGNFAWVIPIFVACSTFGGVNGNLMTSSRLFLSGAREGQMPELLTMLQTDRKTPIPSVIFLTILSMVYLTSANIIDLMNYMGFATWLSIGVAVACLLYLRWKLPNAPRPIKVNLIFPILYVSFTAGLTGFHMITNPMETLMGSLMIFSSLPIYWIFIAPKKTSDSMVGKISGSITSLIQKLFMTLPSSG